MTIHERRANGLTRFAWWWLVLFGHHPPDEADHMLSCQAGPHKLFICARCTGQYIGALIGILFAPLLANISLLTFILLAALLPAPAALDWFTQLSRGRASSNWIRIPTGSAFGFLLGVWAYRLWHFTMIDLVVISATVIGYLSLVGLLCIRRRDLIEAYVERYERFLTEHL